MMSSDELREHLQLTRMVVNRARIDNATAENEGRALPYSDEDLVEIRRRVHEAAARARAAGVDISDLVPDAVGDGDFPG
jgi:hypothetical protein